MSPADPEADTGGNAAIDPLLTAILGELWNDAQASARSQGGLSLARLAKRVGVRQSTLRRHLTALEGAGIVKVEFAEGGGGTVALALGGQALCDP